MSMRLLRLRVSPRGLPLLVAWLALGCGDKVVDPRVWEAFERPAEQVETLQRQGFVALALASGEGVAFRPGALLVTPTGSAEIGELLAREAHLERREPVEVRGIVKDEAVAKAAKARSARRRELLEELLPPRFVEVGIDFVQVERPMTWREAKELHEELAGARGSAAVAFDTVLELLRLRELYAKEGFEFALDLVGFPDSTTIQPVGSALVYTTTEGLDSYGFWGSEPAATPSGQTRDPFQDPYWSLHNIPKAWRLAQVAELSRPGVILGVLDDAFADPAGELDPSLILYQSTVAPEDIYKEDSKGFYHGSCMASVGAAPVDNEQGVAGTAFRTGSPGPKRLRPGRPVELAFLRPEDLSQSRVANMIDAAVLDWGVDVITMGFGSYCGGWFCNAFNGWGSVEDAAYTAYLANVLLLASAGNDEKNLGNDRYVPCELWKDNLGPLHLVACVGGNDREGRNTDNYGVDVDTWGPAHHVYSHCPSFPSICLTRGTSVSTPFVGGIVALGLALSGETLDSHELRKRLRSTGFQSPVDGLPKRMFDAYAYLRESVAIADDALEINDLGLEYDGPFVEDGELLSIAHEWGGTDVDHLVFDQVESCGGLRFSLHYIGGSGEPQPEVADMISWTPIAENAWRVGLQGLRTFPIPPPGVAEVRIDPSGSGTTGYSVFDIERLPPLYPDGEGPHHPETCNGEDDDCDGSVDESFPDTDSDETADCQDPDDDGDCIPDALDACPKTAQGHYFCDGFDRTLGPKCKNPCTKYREILVIKELKQCFGGFAWDPSCWDDGCAADGPLLDPAVSRALATLRTAERATGRLGPASRIEALPDGRVRLPDALRDLPPPEPSPSGPPGQPVCGALIQATAKMFDPIATAECEAELKTQSCACP